MNRTKAQGSARGRRRRSEREQKGAQKVAQKRRYYLQKSETGHITFRITSSSLSGFNPFYTLTTQCEHGFQEHGLGGRSREAIIAKAVQLHKAALSCTCNGAPQAYSPTHQ